MISVVEQRDVPTVVEAKKEFPESAWALGEL
jgi:hypothetical protein